MKKMSLGTITLLITLAAMVIIPSVIIKVVIVAADEGETLTICEFTNELLKTTGVIDTYLDNEALIAKAEEIGIMLGGEYGENRYDEAITRQTAAKLVARATNEILGESYSTDTDGIKNSISDFDEICSTCKPYVEQLYAKGIMQGYEDSTFRGTFKLTVPEKDIVLSRLMHTENRLKMMDYM